MEIRNHFGGICRSLVRYWIGGLFRIATIAGLVVGGSGGRSCLSCSVPAFWLFGSLLPSFSQTY